MKPYVKTFIADPLFLIFFIVSVILYGCAELQDSVVSPDPLKNISSCEGCHTNYTALKTLASPDTAETGGGCGGDIPYIEPYDRVYMGGEGFARFKNSTHGKIPCTTCHGGIGNTGDKQVAHSGNFIKHPSLNAGQVCGACHAATTTQYANSLHAQGWGQKSMVVLRSGAPSFEHLPGQMKAGYEKNCARCHATCGDCHVKRPQAGGGGLYKGHEFRRKPNMVDQCTACHISRGKHAYFGIASGTVPDVHLTRLGDGHCLNCHSKQELHGDGSVYDQRYKMPLLPKCENCHTNITRSNMYHLVHINTMNCQTCHSQDYNNCGSCHIGGAGARIASYQGFKIGLNPIPDTKPYKYATLRRSLMAPDSWKNYGVSTLANFDVRPTFKYATPHNIIRWTSRTRVAQGRACYDNCHIIRDGTTYRNKELYLFNSDLQSWELNANKSIVVDGRLPASWGVR